MYVEGLRAKEKEKEGRLAKIRSAMRNMLKANPNVFPYTTFTAGDKLFTQHPNWLQAKIESERKMVFEEYVCRRVQAARIGLFVPKPFQ